MGPTGRRLAQITVTRCRKQGKKLTGKLSRCRFHFTPLHSLRVITRAGDPEKPPLQAPCSRKKSLLSPVLSPVVTQFCHHLRTQFRRFRSHLGDHARARQKGPYWALLLLLLHIQSEPSGSPLATATSMNHHGVQVIRPGMVAADQEPKSGTELVGARGQLPATGWLSATPVQQQYVWLAKGESQPFSSPLVVFQERGPGSGSTAVFSSF